MFNQDFFPTPKNVILQMLEGYDLTGKVVFEPSAGKGDMVDQVLKHGAADVIACEINQDLKKILASKCKVIADDFLTVESHQISHIDFIVMNPPFSADEKHILHAFEIAPAGCTIISLCNLNTVKNPYSETRKKLVNNIENFGDWEDLGDCFNNSERKTGVNVALVKLQKPGNNYKDEFEGFFLDEDPAEDQFNGIMPYNVVRDLVNRYIAAVKLFDEQLSVGLKMHSLLNSFYGQDLAFSCTEKGQPKLRKDFKKDLQKSGWDFIFSKMNMQKYATRGLREDINKFVEKQENIPFTMKNIYRMLEIVIGTQGQRMDKAIVEVFDKLTEHYHDNRYNVSGWKTNSHYLINEKFILPRMCEVSKWDKKATRINTNYGSYFELIEDMLKALCYVTGDNYDNFIPLDHFIRYEFKIVENGRYITAENNYTYAENRLRELRKKGIEAKIISLNPSYGEWFDWGYFEIKAFKKGTMHFKFKSEDLWGKFNQRVAKIKGYPLYEHKKEAPKRKQPERKQAVMPTVLATIKI